MGLKPLHLGKTIGQLFSYFISLRDKFQFNVCGEGGEYESAVFDCPIFKRKKIISVESEVIHHSDNDFAPVAYIQFGKLELIDKNIEEI